jgi:acylphosphatase
MIQRRILISGQVQGVGFRASTYRASARLPGLCGYVRNLPDGRVEAVFMGDDQAVHDMIAWCKKGPRAAIVNHLEVLEEVIDPTLKEFQIL